MSFSIEPYSAPFTLHFPSGALAEITNITVQELANPPADPGYVAGTAFDFGPDGQKFLKPVTLTIAYKPSAVPQGMVESALRLAELVDGQWQQIASSQVNTTAHIVTGAIKGFCIFGIVGGRGGQGNFSAGISPGSPTCFPGTEIRLNPAISNPPPGFDFSYHWSTTGKYGALNKYAYGSAGIYEKISTGSGLSVNLENGGGSHPDYVTFTVNTDAPDGSTDTITLEVYGRYTGSAGQGTWNRLDTATSTVKIAFPTFSIEPSTAYCTQGSQVRLDPVVHNMPWGLDRKQFEFVWTVDGKYGTLVRWLEGNETNHKFNDVGDSLTSHDTGNGYMTYEASPNAPDGSTVTVYMWARSFFINNTTTVQGDWLTSLINFDMPGPRPGDVIVTGNMYSWNGDHPATAVITITKSNVSIVSARQMMIDVRSLDKVELTAKVLHPPAGTLSYEWTTTGKYGGFGSAGVRQAQYSSQDVDYVLNGLGADGDIETITVDVYSVQGSRKTILGKATATLDVYKPMTVYSICSNAAGTETYHLGGGSSWAFLVVNHGWVGGAEKFYARRSDQVRVRCDRKGSPTTLGSNDLYLKRGMLGEPGETMLLVSSGEIRDGLDKTLNITI